MIDQVSTDNVLGCEQVVVVVDAIEGSSVSFKISVEFIRLLFEFVI
jgi:hypothetical protein